MGHGAAGGWTSPGEAPLLYWVIAAIVIVAVVGFQPIMPSFKGQLAADDINDIIEYLKTLK